MNKKILSLILAVGSCLSVAAATKTVSVNLTIGVGETKSLSNYLKEGASVTKWTTNAPAVATVSNNSVKGIKEGVAVVKGTGAGTTYLFKVSVLKNFTGYQNIENEKEKDNKNSRGEVINHTERHI